MNVNLTRRTHALEPGDLVAFCPDGRLETTNEHGETWQGTRLEELLLAESAGQAGNEPNDCSAVR